jgi:hypothetical protein
MSENNTSFKFKKNGTEELINQLSAINHVSNTMSRRNHALQNHIFIDSEKNSPKDSFYFGSLSESIRSGNRTPGVDTNFMLLGKKSFPSLQELEQESIENDENLINNESFDLFNETSTISNKTKIYNQSTVEKALNSKSVQENTWEQKLKKIEMLVLKKLFPKNKKKKIKSKLNQSVNNDLKTLSKDNSEHSYIIPQNTIWNKQHGNGFNLFWGPSDLNNRFLKNVKQLVQNEVEKVIKKYDYQPQENNLIPEFDNSMETLKIFPQKKQKSFFNGFSEKDDSLINFDIFSPPQEEHSSGEPDKTSMADLSTLPTLPSSSKKPVKPENQILSDSEEKSILSSASHSQEFNYSSAVKLFTQNSDFHQISSDLFEKLFHFGMKPIVQKEEENINMEYKNKMFLFYFKMGISHNKSRIKAIPLKEKFRLIMYLAVSFIDLDEAFDKFSNFPKFENLKKQMSHEEPLLIDIYEKSQDQCQLEKIFYSRTTNEPGKVMEQTKFTKLYKKMLIVLVSLIDLMKIFINDKSQRAIFEEKNYYEKYKLVISNAFPKKHLRKINIDSSILTMSLEDLLKQINLLDLCTLFSFNNPLIKKKQKKQIFFRDVNNEMKSVCITLEDQTRFFCHKFKRPFLCRKFLFKFIRNQIFKNFKAEMLDDNSLVSVQEIKHQFQEQYFQSNECLTLYESENINKKNLKMLGKMNDPIISKIKHYISSNLIGDLIDKWEKDPEPPMFNKFLTFTTFGHFMMHFIKKRPLLFSECVKELVLFNEWFGFDN